MSVLIQIVLQNEKKIKIAQLLEYVLEEYISNQN